MAVNYAPIAKTARMTAVRSLLDGGCLEILSGTTLLAKIMLPNPCGMVSGDSITCSPEQGTFAVAKGRATAARLCSASDEPVITGLTVGKTNADVILDYVDLEKGQIITVTAMTFKHA